jgi:hypothetical protein
MAKRLDSLVQLSETLPATQRFWLSFNTSSNSVRTHTTGNKTCEMRERELERSKIPEIAGRGNLPLFVCIDVDS